MAKPSCKAWVSKGLLWNLTPAVLMQGLRANPMRDCAARQKPMTATATRMVKAIWHDYFVRTGNKLPGDSFKRSFMCSLAILAFCITLRPA